MARWVWLIFLAQTSPDAEWKIGELPKRYMNVTCNINLGTLIASTSTFPVFLNFYKTQQKVKQNTIVSQGLNLADARCDTVCYIIV